MEQKALIKARVLAMLAHRDHKPDLSYNAMKKDNQTEDQEQLETLKEMLSGIPTPRDYPTEIRACCKY